MNTHQSLRRERIDKFLVLMGAAALSDGIDWRSYRFVDCGLSGSFATFRIKYHGSLLEPVDQQAAPPAVYPITTLTPGNGPASLAIRPGRAIEDIDQVFASSVWTQLKLMLNGLPNDKHTLVGLGGDFVSEFLFCVAQEELDATRNSAETPRPTTPTQSQFIASTAIEAGFCGGHGAGKTWSLLFGAAQYVQYPEYRALLLRRSYPELKISLIEQSPSIYKPLGGEYDPGRKRWTFPSGATVEFASAEDVDDVFQFAGAEYQYIGFDMLNMFDKLQYEYMLSRLRNSNGLPLRMRSTFPDNVDSEWVSSYFAPWLASDETAVDGGRAESGEVVHYKREPTGARRVTSDTPGTVSRTLIKANVGINQHLAEPGHETQSLQ